MKGLGCSPADWRAAQVDLARRTAVALQPLPAAATATPCAATAAATTPQPPAAAPLDGLLLAAVNTPTWHPGSLEASALHNAVEQLLWVLRQFPAAMALAPPNQPQLSDEGWAAYWMLEPRVSGAWACAWHELLRGTCGCCV